MSFDVDGTPPVATLRFPQGSQVTSRGSFLVEVDFSERLRTADPTASIAFVRTAGTGSLPGGLLRSRAGDASGRRFEYSFQASYADNGTYSIELEGADDLGNPLDAQPAGNTLVVNIANNPPVALAVGPSLATTGTMTFSNPTSSRTTFLPTLEGTYSLRLVVTDVNGAPSLPSGFAVAVAPGQTANTAPEANAGADSFILAGRTATLQGSANDPDGDTLVYSWSLALSAPGSDLTTGPLPQGAGGGTLSPVFTPDLPGVYTLVLTVRDSRGLDATSVTHVVADDHPGTPAEAGEAQALPSQGGSRIATLQADTDVDCFSLAVSPGKIYVLGLHSQGIASVELSLLDSNGLTVISRGTATAATPLRLPDFRAPVAKTVYLRVLSANPAATGGYRLEVQVEDEVFIRPPALTLTTRLVAGQLEATVHTEGTSVPLSFLQFLTEYDGADLTLLGRTAEASASGFGLDAQQYSRPFVDTLLQAAGSPRPVTPGELVTLDFRPGSGRSPLQAEVHVIYVSATPPPPLARVSTFRPSADAGLELSLGIVDGQVPDMTVPGRPLASYLRLDGRQSSDSNVPSLPLEYSWSVLASPGAGSALSDPSSPVPRASLAGPGLYSFGLTVSNGVLRSPTSVVTVLLSGAQKPPYAEITLGSSVTGVARVPASAGAFTVAAGTTVSLDGGSSTDPDGQDRSQLTYRWEFVEGPVPVPLQARRLVTFAAVVPGVYRVRLTVLDPRGLASRPAEALIVVTDPGDAPPGLSVTALSSTTDSLGADLGADPATSSAPTLRVAAGSEVILQAQASDDDLASGVQKGLFYWKQVKGSAVRLVQSDTPPLRSRVTFTPEAPGVYEFQCRHVSAGTDGSALGPEVQRQLRVVVDGATKWLPTAIASRPSRVPGKASDDRPEAVFSTQPAGSALDNFTPGTVVTLDGTWSHGGAALGYSWVQVRGPVVELSDPFSAVTTFVVPDLGDSASREYAFQLFVDDSATGNARSSPAVVELLGGPEIVDQPPTAAAGPDQTVRPPALVTLSGSGIDPEGAALAYRWRRVSGPPASFSSATEARPTFLAAEAGEYVLGLTVNDGTQDSVEDLVVVTATYGPVNQRPTASAGADQYVSMGQTVTLSGAGSDPESAPLTYLWRQVAGPTVSLSRTAVASPSFVPSRADAHVFGLRVSDGVLTSDEDFVTIRALEPGNLPPAADAGQSQAVLAGTLVTLLGGGHDPEGAALTYSWRQVSGSSVVLSEVTSRAPTFTPLRADTLVFGLTVRDGTFLSDEALVTVTVRLPSGAPGEPIPVLLSSGLNLVSLPVNPSTTGAPYDLASLALKTGSPFVAYDAMGEDGAHRWRVFLPGTPPAPPQATGNQAYLVKVPGASVRMISFEGSPWPAQQRLSVPLSDQFGGLALPGPALPGKTAQDLLQFLKARLLFVTQGGEGQPGQFRVLLPGSLAALATELEPGRGYYYLGSQSTPATADLTELLSP
ncbi:MAG: hypothetical protein HY814_01915 [Candidatus Riflebacteria bacterium]|nr:hypothetical protein [Candidatus Riflebacteria bacterium]